MRAHGNDQRMISRQDDSRNPYCRLILRYGSKDILQAMEIVPRKFTFEPSCTSNQFLTSRYRR